MPKTKAIVCPQCGSVNINRIDEDDAVCCYCGCQFKIEQEKIINNNIVNNEIHYHINGEEYENIDKVNTQIIKLDTNIDEYALKRKTLIALCKKGVSYEEISKFSFKEPVVSYYSSIVVEMKFDFSYSVTLGNYREEVYYVPIQVYSGTVNRYVTRQERRTRIVTDWRPFSGRDVQVGIGSLCLNNELVKGDVSPNNADFLIKSYVSKHPKCGGTIMSQEERFPLIDKATSQDENAVKELCEKDAAEKVCKGMPGDVHKHERCIAEDSTYISKRIYYYPICKQAYVYNGTTYIGYSLFTEDGENIITIPKNAPVSSEFQISESNVAKENRREGKYVLMLTLGILSFVASFICGICMIRSFYSGVDFMPIYGYYYDSSINGWLTVLLFIVFVLLIVSGIVLLSSRHKRLKAETKREYKEGLAGIRDKKIQTCNRVLKEHGLYLLTNEEIEKF